MPPVTDSTRNPAADAADAADSVDAVDAADAALLARYAADRSDDAFALLVQRHLTLVFSAALRHLAGDRHQAEDVTQAVFVELARQAPRLASHPTVVGWLYTTTRHLAAHARRDQHRRREREQKAHAMHQLDRDPPLDWCCIRPVLDDAMQDLREPDRLAVLLRYFEGRDLRTVGRALGVSEDAARMRVERALERLRRLLARRRIITSSSALALCLGANAAETLPAGLALNIAATVALQTTTVGSTAFAAVANSGTAAASASTPTATVLGSGAASGSWLPSIHSAVLSMKAPLLATGVATLLVAVPVLIQNQRLQALDQSLAGLRADAADLESLLAERERQASLAAVAREIEELRANAAELARLREEAGRLRPPVSSPLNAELAAARVARQNAEAERQKEEQISEFRRFGFVVIESMKTLGLAARIHATDQGDRLPSRFEEMTHALSGAQLPDGIELDRFEFYPHPRPISEREPQLFLFREKVPREDPEGGWVRSYTLVDGSVQTVRSDSPDFSQVEVRMGGIASPEIPEAVRDDPVFRAPQP